MHIARILAQKETVFSFEFFPPKTPKGSLELYETIKGLIPLNPGYVSVTYGAGGSLRENTHELVTKLQQENRLNVVAHLTCVDQSKEDINLILKRYDESKIHNIMVLRGDGVNGDKFIAHPNGFKYAFELVDFIKKNYPHMGIGVAGFPEGHPDTPNRLKEIEYLKQKVDYGADYICTQMFFDNNQFYDFCERCELANIKVPIIAGIMPITSLKGMQKMAQLSLGTKFPAGLLRALLRATSDEGVENVGIHWASNQVMDLMDKRVKGIHFYTLNKSLITQNIYRSVGL